MKNYFAENIKFLREENNMDQKDLAKLLNVGRSTISCWENGLRTPKMDMIVKISMLFKLGQDIILTDLKNEKIKKSYIEKKYEHIDLNIIKNNKLSNSSEQFVETIVKKDMK